MLLRFAVCALGVLSMTLAACGSSPPVSFYSLPPMSGEYREDPADSPVLGLGPLRVPDYLKRPQFVSRGDGAEILVDETARWAEPLDAALHRTLAANVDQLLDGVAVVGFPDTDGVSLDYRLVGRVTRFDVDRAGDAVLEVQWRFESGNGTDLGPPRRDRFSARSSRPADPAAQAAALNDTLAQFSRAIAAELRSRGATGN